MSPYQLAGKRIWVAGHRGMVGSALVRRLEKENCEVLSRGHSELDLRDQAGTRAWIMSERPDAVVIAAAKVGGIMENNTRPAEFLYDNLMIEANIIEASYRCGVEKLLFLGSSCIYPKFADQPIAEDALLTGPLEPTNEAYAIAKIAGIKLVQAYRRQYGCDFISAMPTNLYGPGDNFELASSHVLPALLRQAAEAESRRSKTIEIWGTGTPRREFLHVDDCADALVFLLKHYSDEAHVNVGSGIDISILELAELVCEVVGITATITKDLSKPDGTPQKLMSAGKLTALGWKPKVELRRGVEETYRWFLSHHGSSG